MNTLVARQNCYRVTAETVRDLFLSCSGLLNPTVGGPSVRPPLPKGIAELGYANSVKWPVSPGADKFRRGIYIHFQRTVPYPMLMTFDCPDSNVSAIRRTRSNTPLQALTLMNDPVFFECAQALAARACEEGPQDRLLWLFRTCLARAPRERELESLRRLLDDQSEVFSEDIETAGRVVGEYLPEGIEAAAMAPWVMVARAVMNLDEFVTRE